MREIKLDSNKMLMDSKETSANAERYPLFCHADKSARNDRKRASFPPQDFFTHLQRILGFCDDFGGFQGSGKGAYLSVCNRRHCRRIHQKRAKAESTSEKLTKGEINA